MSKIFISYKYRDNLVEQIPRLIVEDLGYTSPRSYVDMLDLILSRLGHVCKAEKANESLAGLSEDTIARKLADRLYDSTVSLVLISKGMDTGEAERDQWIPWEVSYSLTEHTRGDRTSATNAMIAIVLPDEAGLYNYFVTDHSCIWCGARTWHKRNTFNIIGSNMFNRLEPTLTDCSSSTCGNTDIHIGNDHSYIQPVKWSEFIVNPDLYINFALTRKEEKESFDITKRLD